MTLEGVRQMAAQKPAYMKKEEKLRVCLRCGKKFKSTWSGHRICPQCETIENARRKKRLN